MAIFAVSNLEEEKMFINADEDAGISVVDDAQLLLFLHCFRQFKVFHADMTVDRAANLRSKGTVRIGALVRTDEEMAAIQIIKS